MMINKRLIRTVSESKKYIACNVIFQWMALAANIVMIGTICRLLQCLWERGNVMEMLPGAAGIVVGMAGVRFGCHIGASRMSSLSSRAVKGKLREMIYRKLLRLGISYREQIRTSQVVHDSPVYIFDEATSNIDMESENDIMALILELTKWKTVVLISHRLANVVKADRIYVMDQGQVAESGSHEELLKKKGQYARMWEAQQSLENYGKREIPKDNGILRKSDFSKKESFSAAGNTGNRNSGRAERKRRGEAAG